MASSKKLSFSFDIGHSSIGWAVLEKTNSFHPEILGSGVVTFPADDCLASTRRDHRRTRRNIRSTRQRIERLKLWLEHRNVLTREELDLPGHAAPFLLASAALTGVRKLTALELWHVLRWYAHNRGYDGNSRWSRQDDDESEDTEKVKNAKEQLNKYGTETMAETVCQLLDLEPANVDKKISSFLPYKTLNTAYPRSIVTEEVSRILDLHRDQLDGLDATTCKLIFPDRDLSPEERALLISAKIKLPKRYHGGLLFGQLVPRFDNRIISRCPITWAKIYRAEIDKNTEEKEACRIAERDAKVPAKKCFEFLEYRLARILANLKADGEPVSAATRQAIFKKAQDQGRLSHKDLETIIQQHHPDSETNIHTYFQLHPDSEDALVFDPVMHELHKAKNTGKTLKPFWKYLPESADASAIEAWSEGNSINLHWIIEQTKGTGNEANLESEIEKQFKKAKKNYADIDDYCQRTKASAKWPTGRAPFARPVLKQVTKEIIGGHDATKACIDTDSEKGEKKTTDGILYEFSVPTSEVNQLLQKRPLEKLTNNPLVRHRLLILERLLEDMIREFSPDDETAIEEITVEVAREVKERGGKGSSAMKEELTKKLRSFKSAVTHLEKEAPTLPITGVLIRKCRIAMDMDWTCPFTGKKYDAYELPKLELEHIIPFSSRKTNALHALVLTWREVNSWKSNRTARQFVIDEGGNKVPNKEKLSILCESPYLKLAGKLKVKGHDDDRKRQRARKALLEITVFDKKEQGFTEGALTQSSHLIKLAMRSVKIRLPKATLVSIPGIATGEIRKSWSLLGTLGHPDVCGNEAMRWLEKRDRLTGQLITEGYDKFPALGTPDSENKKAVKAAPICPNDECEKPLSWPTDDSISQTHCPHCHAILRRVPKPKDEIRSLTHQHHALDALTIGLITHYFPLTKFGQNQSGKIWTALVNRNKTGDEKQLLRSLKLFNEHERRDKKDISKVRTEFRLKPLHKDVKEQVIHHLAQGRVVQHVPANRSGTKAELTTWSIVHFDDEKCIVLQRPNRSNFEVETSSSPPRWKNQKPSKEALKLLDEYGAHLSTKQTTLVKRGILKLTSEPITKVLGPNPTSQPSKLQPHSKGKGAIVIEENYGIALDPKPLLIPFHKVTETLSILKKANNGQAPRVIRKGDLIRVAGGTWKGTWKVISTKHSDAYGVSVDLALSTHLAKAKGNAKIPDMLEQGLEILSPPLTGINPES